jgi:hypothetical protein
VLHPRKLSVYTLQAIGSSYLQLSKLYEHALEHTAANLAYGPFAGVAGEAVGTMPPCWWPNRSTCNFAGQKCLVGLIMDVLQQLHAACSPTAAK